MQLAEFGLKDLHELSAERAVEIFKKLLHCEALKWNLPATSITISENTNEPDDGIDASFNYPDSYQGIIQEGILKNTSISYQIKADNKFSSLSESSLIGEFFNLTSSEYNRIKYSTSELKKKLKKGISSALDRNHYYILVSFRTELTPKKKKEKIELIKSLFKQCGYDNANVDIFDACVLQCAFNSYPGIILPFKNKKYISTVSDVLSRGEFNSIFKDSDTYKIFKNKLKDYISNQNNVRLRIVGEPGIGKTRIILEFCKGNDNVLYFEDPSYFYNSGLIEYLLAHHELPQNHLNMVVIVDECDFDYFNDICSKIYRFHSIKFISIYQENDNQRCKYQTFILDAPSLSDADIKSILSDDYSIPYSDAERIAQFIGGYPRFAHFIGESYSRDGSLLGDEKSIFENFVAKSKDKNEKEIIVNVLMYLSVFKKFVFEGEDNTSEKNFICEFIRSGSPNLTDDRIEDVINNLKNNKIIQNLNIHYISPKLLHVWLYREFWKNESRIGYLYNKLYACPDRLKQWFYEMFIYAKTASIPIDIPKKFLKTYKFTDFLCKDKVDFFFNLTVADPACSLSVLCRIFNNLDDRTIENCILSNYYSYSILTQSLSIIAADSSLFEVCLELIYRFSLLETDDVMWPLASKLFIQLFQIYVPGTDLSLNNRLIILNSLLKNCNTNSGLNLIIKTLNHALDPSNCVRIENYFKGSLTNFTDYTPNADEISQYVEVIITDLIYQCILKCNFDNNEKLLNDIFSSLTRVAVQFQDKVNTVILCIQKIITLNKVNTLLMFKFLSDTINYLSFFDLVDYPHLSQFIENITNLKTKILGSPLKLEYYLNKNIYDGPQTDNYPEQFITEIYSVFSSLSLDEQHKYLKTFIYQKYDNEYYFGKMIARFYFDLESLNTYVKYYVNSKNQNNIFLAGFVAECFFSKHSDRKLDVRDFNKFIDNLISVHLNDVLINLLLHAGSNDYFINKIINLIYDGSIGVEKIGKIAVPLSQASPEAINQLMFFSLKNKSSIAIKNIITIIYHVTSKETVIKLSTDLLSDCILSAILTQNNRPVLVVNRYYDWFTCIHKYLKTCENNNTFLKDNNSVNEVLDCFLWFVSDSGKCLSYDQSVNNLLEHFFKCFENHKNIFWSFLISHLKHSVVTINPIKNWLKGESLSNVNYKNSTPGIYYFSLDFLFSWIEEDVNNNLRLIALSCPKDLFNSDNSFMRALISRYGDQNGLFETIINNLNSGLYYGLISDSFRTNINYVNELLNSESIDLNIKNFLGIYKDKLNKNFSIQRKNEEENDLV